MNTGDIDQTSGRQPTFAEADGCGICDLPQAGHAVQQTPAGWRQSIGPLHTYQAPTARQVQARVDIRLQQAVAAKRHPGIPTVTVTVSPMAPPPEDPFVTEIEGVLYRILINYEREGSGPGSRFEGKTLERVQAEQAIQEVRRHDRQHPPATSTTGGTP